MKYSWTLAKIFYVSDYDAYPNDNKDDTYGIQTAINDAIRIMNQ